MKLLEEYLREHPKRFLIFDFDETLCTLHLPWEIFYRELPPKLTTLDAEFIQKKQYRRMTDLINHMVNQHGEKAIRIIHPYCEQFEMNYLRHLSVNHELLHFIRKHVGQYTYFVWSSNMTTTIKTHLINQGVYHYFSDVITRDRVRLTKPFTDGFTHIYRPEISTRSEYLMIGDSDYDAHAAQGSGIDYLKIKLETTPEYA